MRNISIFRNCYGCGVCSLICPQKIIRIELSGDGFYEPRITDTDKCIDCGLCLNACAFNDSEICAPNDRKIRSYAAWSKDVAIRQRCSSGGIGFEISRYLIGRGYKVCAVKYNPAENRSEHYMALTVDGQEYRLNLFLPCSKSVSSFRSTT